MSVRRILSTTAALSLVLLGTVLVNPANAVVLQCGEFIETPGTTVVLTADIDCTGKFDVFGVAIIADHVTLDLNGHTIKGDGFQVNDHTSTIGVYV